VAQGLLHHFVVRVTSEEPIDPAAISVIARDLGDPPAYTGVGVAAVPGHEIIGDFTARAKPDDGRPRKLAPTEVLHQDVGPHGLSAYSILHARDVPSIRPMRWASMRAAYESLSDDVRFRIDGLRAIHSSGPDRADGPRRPLVLVHPKTAEPVLHLPLRRDAIVEKVGETEGEALIRTLWDAVEGSSVRYHQVLESNDLYVWDNIATSHDNPTFPRDQDRVIWFLTIPCETKPKGYVQN
jgi:alpha-ketoglutarate-dependent taurine dioxygenase